MKVTILGATGSLGHECLAQSLSAGHEVTVLARTPGKLPDASRARIRLVEGDALDARCIEASLAQGVEGVLFAIGVDRRSPENLCTDVTRHVLDAMPRLGVRRFVWCGGGSTIVQEDAVTFGAKFVEAFGRAVLGKRHRDKVHQLELLDRHRDLQWLGVRPLQMRKGPMRAEYRLGFHPYSGFSQISFADCAHAMLGMLTDDTWLHRAPILQY